MFKRKLEADEDKENRYPASHVRDELCVKKSKVGSPDDHAAAHDILIDNQNCLVLDVLSPLSCSVPKKGTKFLKLII